MSLAIGIRRWNNNSGGTEHYAAFRRSDGKLGDYDYGNYYSHILEMKSGLTLQAILMLGHMGLHTIICLKLKLIGLVQKLRLSLLVVICR